MSIDPQINIQTESSPQTLQNEQYAGNIYNNMGSYNRLILSML